MPASDQPTETLESAEDHPRILVVDDEPRSVELLVRTLRRLGDVSPATSGEEGWELAQRIRPTLVVTDQRMPGMQGSELLARIAEMDHRCGRLLLTGYSDLDSTVSAINEGRVHVYVTKPWKPAQLLATVATLLERVQLEYRNHRLLEVLSDRNEDLEIAMAQLREAQHELLRVPGTNKRITSLHELISRNVVAAATGLDRRLRRIAQESPGLAQDELVRMLHDSARDAARIGETLTNFLALKDTEKPSES